MKFLYSLVVLSLVQANVNARTSFAAPTLPATNLSFNQIDGAFFNIGWSPGNGARRIMIAKAGSAPTFIPVNGVDYAENTAFGSGQQVAAGEFVVYDHFGTSFFLTNLNPATTYFFKIYEYNGTGAAIEYLISSFLAGSGMTSATPTTQTSNATFNTITTNSINFSWQLGNGGRRLIVMREGSAVNADPVMSTQYNVNSVFGSGAQIGTGNYTVYASSGVSTTVTNLKSGTAYHMAFYEYNGNAQPQYLKPAYTSVVITRSVPTIASTNLVILKVDGKELFLDWTSGNGQRRIIVAKKGSAPTFVPVNGTEYNANAIFGTGQQPVAGEFIVYNNNFHLTSVSGLDPASQYFFKIYEYDGVGNTTAYLTSASASVNGFTAATPLSPAMAPEASQVTANSMRIQFTSGDGRARLIIGRKNSPVSVAPVNFTTYSANGNFGQGQDLGNGNFVVSNTTENGAIIHSLEPNSTYHFIIVEYNGFNQPLYLSPATAMSTTTLSGLPVKLSSWEAIPSNNKVKLQWTSASEINTSHYIVERSADGVQYSPITTVNAASNSQSTQHYSTIDNNPLPGKSFYRLKMVDIDEKFEYSPVRVVVISSKSVVRIVANPVQTRLELVTSTSNRGEWQIINRAGQIVSKGVINSNRTEINVSSMSAGSYWVRSFVDGRAQTIPFIKR